MVARFRFRSQFVSVLLAVSLLLLSCGLLACSTTRVKPKPADLPFSVSTIELPYRGCSKPQKVGSAIYTTVSRGVDKGSSLIRYDLKSKTIKTVIEAPDPDLIGWFTVNEHWLVWNVGSELFVQSLNTGERQLLASSSSDLYAPELNGNLAAWVDQTPDRTYRLVICDLSTRKTTVVAPIVLAELYNNFPTWDGDRLVWTDIIDNKGHYRIFDVKTGAKYDYTLSDVAFRYPGYAKARGDRIYSINFDRFKEWDWSIQRLGYYLTSEKRFVPIVADGFITNYFEIAGDFIAIIDSSMQLTLRPVDEREGQTREWRPVKGRVDFIQVSSDQTLIATREAIDDKHCRLYIIRKKGK